MRVFFRCVDSAKSDTTCVDLSGTVVINGDRKCQEDMVVRLTFGRV
jgi:hypothetical protein